MSKEEKSKVKN